MESTTDNKFSVCIPCYTNELGTRGVILANLPLETCMKEKLMEANVQEVNKKASLFELFDMYKAIVLNDSMGWMHASRATNNSQQNTYYHPLHLQVIEEEMSALSTSAKEQAFYNVGFLRMVLPQTLTMLG
jgi:hypothetical protein